MLRRRCTTAARLAAPVLPLPLPLVLLLLLCCVVMAALPHVVMAAKSGSCTFISAPPAYTFIGGGFHMQLAIEYPVASQDVHLSFHLPKSFFVDEAEAEQLYRMELLSADPMKQGTSAIVMADLTRAYTPLQMASQHFFDIEAPVFKVGYTTNHVELSFAQRGDGSSALDRYLTESGSDSAVSFRARLVLPIHSRYDALDTDTPFSAWRFITGEDAYVRRCLPEVSMSGTADPRCSASTFASVATSEKLAEKAGYVSCLDLPVGVLADLPHVYRALMGLLVAGAVMVIAAIR
ncbi:hypothetical protein NESM_000204800 [Novymonas esmeraldas]|uniref:Uncharacterized protein n=1 Tax=Novymonas esmeraldas TaxID=1808958 RepID=A0AAW0F6I6_9TRYP